MHKTLTAVYSQYTNKITKKAKQAFNNAMNDVMGLNYHPIAFSAQIVDGINYKFFCNSEASSSPPISGAAIVTIFAPTNGAAHITHIQSI